MAAFAVRHSTSPGFGKPGLGQLIKCYGNGSPRTRRGSDIYLWYAVTGPKSHVLS
jgi:hypothetical protein